MWLARSSPWGLQCRLTVDAISSCRCDRTFHGDNKTLYILKTARASIDLDRRRREGPTVLDSVVMHCCKRQFPADVRRDLHSSDRALSERRFASRAFRAAL